MRAEHFKISSHHMMCEWANKVAELVAVSHTMKICSECRKVVIKGEEQRLPVEVSNSPDHLGSVRAALYREGKQRTAVHYYNPRIKSSLKSEPYNLDKSSKNPYPVRP